MRVNDLAYRTQPGRARRVAGTYIEARVVGNISCDNRNVDIIVPMGGGGGGG